MRSRDGVCAGIVGVAVAAMFLIAPAPFAAVAHPQSPAALPDVRTLGPKVGDRIPAFTLSDQHGQPRTLDSLMGPKGLMLMFFRSADW